MERYLPGAILALCGVAVYAIGCMLFLAQRRQRGREGPNKSLFVYAIVLMVLGFCRSGRWSFSRSNSRNITLSMAEALGLNRMTALPAAAA